MPGAGAGPNLHTRILPGEPSRRDTPPAPHPVKKLIRSILPSRIAQAIATYRTLRRNQARDRQLRADEAHELPAGHIRGLRVVPARRDLLELLPKGAVMAEVGVAFGDFSREILDVCAPRKLYLIDLWDPDEPRYGVAAMESTRRVAARELESGVAELKRGFSWDAIATLPDASLDWVYLDAAHDFDSVRKDLEAVLPKMREGGIISGHDYTRWSSAGVHRFGVVEAVNGFCLREGWEMVYLTNESDRHVSYAIRAMRQHPGPDPAASPPGA